MPDPILRPVEYATKHDLLELELRLTREIHTSRDDASAFRQDIIKAFGNVKVQILIWMAGMLVALFLGLKCVPA